MIDRRALIAASGAALLLPRPALSQARNNRFSWDGIIAMAQKLARAPFAETPPNPVAAKVGYDQMHQARFRDEKTIWDRVQAHYDAGANHVCIQPFRSDAPGPDLKLLEAFAPAKNG